MRVTGYDSGGFHDEMFDGEGRPRAWYALLAERLAALPDGEVTRRQRAAEQALRAMGITFNVYGDAAGKEKIFPFDLIPRIVST